MLTIKHVEPNGHESLFSAVSASRLVISTEKGIRYEVQAYEVPGAVSEDGINRYANGKVFVMNDFGKTVAIYDLDEAPLKSHRVSGT